MDIFVKKYVKKRPHFLKNQSELDIVNLLKTYSFLILYFMLTLNFFVE